MTEPVPIPAEGRNRRLVLLRHGRTAYNASGRFQGKLDPPLDDGAMPYTS